MDIDKDKIYMAEAIAEAEAAFDCGEVPVGCVAVLGDEIIANAGNDRETGDPTGHAEMIALKKAGEAIGSRVLEDVTLYVTLEPCPMCMAAIMIARVGRLVYGAPDPKLGAAVSGFNIVNDPRFGHSIRVTSGVMADKCSDILRRFFENARSR